MKLRNKKTGEIGEVGYSANSSGEIIVNHIDDLDEWYTYKSLAELNEEWEDMPEEPKEHWYIDWDGKLMSSTDEEGWKAAISIGNYFSSKEEAEKAVEKLKAWKRLKDKGFRFENNSLDICCHTINFKIDRQFDMTDETSKDLHLLFGGKQ